MLKTTRNLALVFAACMLAVACHAPEHTAVPAAPAAPDYRAMNEPAFDMFIGVLNSKDYQKLDGVFAENFRRVAPDQNANGPEEMAAFISQLHAAYPDLHISIGESVYAKDLSFNQWTVTGTATRQDGTTTPVEIDGMTMCRYAKGEITEEWVYYDTAQITNVMGESTMPHAK